MKTNEFPVYLCKRGAGQYYFIHAFDNFDQKVHFENGEFHRETIPALASGAPECRGLIFTPKQYFNGVLDKEMIELSAVKVDMSWRDPKWFTRTMMFNNGLFPTQLVTVPYAMFMDDFQKPGPIQYGHQVIAVSDKDENGHFVFVTSHDSTTFHQFDESAGYYTKRTRMNHGPSVGYTYWYYGPDGLSEWNDTNNCFDRYELNQLRKRGKPLPLRMGLLKAWLWIKKRVTRDGKKASKGYTTF